MFNRFDQSHKSRDMTAEELDHVVDAINRDLASGDGDPDAAYEAFHAEGRFPEVNYTQWIDTYAEIAGW